MKMEPIKILNRNNYIEIFQQYIDTQTLNVKYFISKDDKNREEKNHSSEQFSAINKDDEENQLINIIGNDGTCVNNSSYLFTCPICREKFKTKDHFNRHLVIKHTPSTGKKYQCPNCPYQNDCVSKIYEHLSTHGNLENVNKKKYLCPRCPFKTHIKRNLNRHLLIHDGIKLFQCEICGKQFSENTGLKFHMKTQHVDSSVEKEFKCAQCPYEARLKNSLHHHVKMKHLEDTEGAKKYKCTQCNFQARYKQYLKNHLSVHEEKQFKCPVCDKQFRRKSHLSSHLRNVHGSNDIKDYKCTKCNYQTNYGQCLKAHSRIHDDVRPYECKLCNVAFRQKQHLKTHAKYKHKDCY